MTLDERMQAIEREEAQSRARLDRVEELLFATVQTVNALVGANNTNAETVKMLADKIDRFVDAVFHRGSKNGKGEGEPTDI